MSKRSDFGLHNLATEEDNDDSVLHYQPDLEQMFNIEEQKLGQYVLKLDEDSPQQHRIVPPSSVYEVSSEISLPSSFGYSSGISNMKLTNKDQNTKSRTHTSQFVPDVVK